MCVISVLYTYMKKTATVIKCCQRHYINLLLFFLSVLSLVGVTTAEICTINLAGFLWPDALPALNLLKKENAWWRFFCICSVRNLATLWDRGRGGYLTFLQWFVVHGTSELVQGVKVQSLVKTFCQMCFSRDFNLWLSLRPLANP